MDVFEFRRAAPDDYPKLESLQKKYLKANLSAEEQQDGFLSAMLNASELAAINGNLAVVVCDDGERTLGFLAAGTVEFNSRLSLPINMISRLPQIEYDGKPLTSYKCIVSGPICIDKEARGKGVFRGLYRALFELLPEEYELSLTLVSQSNGRSLSAHERIGYRVVDQFQFENRSFNTLILPITHTADLI